ncbi:MAG: hypothetical protein GXX79_18955 [Actinomycetales bacterium]|nr:hypothetical protein [Actinomycetales bacterium]
MRSIPVKESAFAGLMCVMAPEPKLVDVKTGEVKRDQATGQTVWTVGVCALRGRDSSVIQISVVGEPRGLSVGMPLRVVDLEATPWEREGRSGIAWRAGQVLSATEAPPGPTTGGRGGGKEGQ